MPKILNYFVLVCFVLLTYYEQAFQYSLWQNQYDSVHNCIIKSALGLCVRYTAAED